MQHFKLIVDKNQNNYNFHKVKTSIQTPQSHLTWILENQYPFQVKVSKSIPRDVSVALLGIRAIDELLIPSGYLRRPSCRTWRRPWCWPIQTHPFGGRTRSCSTQQDTLFRQTSPPGSLLSVVWCCLGNRQPLKSRYVDISGGFALFHLNTECVFFLGWALGFMCEQN